MAGPVRAMGERRGPRVLGYAGLLRDSAGGGAGLPPPAAPWMSSSLRPLGPGERTGVPAQGGLGRVRSVRSQPPQAAQPGSRTIGARPKALHIPGSPDVNIRTPVQRSYQPATSEL